MRTDTSVSPVRTGFDEQQLALAEVLCVWDPIGCYHGTWQNPIRDEYDDLVRPTLALLRLGTTPDTLARELREALRVDYRMGVVHSTRAAAHDILTWWATQPEAGAPTP